MLQGMNFGCSTKALVHKLAYCSRFLQMFTMADFDACWYCKTDFMSSPMVLSSAGQMVALQYPAAGYVGVSRQETLSHLIWTGLWIGTLLMISLHAHIHILVRLLMSKASWPLRDVSIDLVCHVVS